MGNFVHYLDRDLSLENWLLGVFDELRLPDELRYAIMAFLNLVKTKDRATYEHVMRVGYLTHCIARFMHLDERALLYAGLLHDVGKTLTNLKTLQRTDGWSPADAAEIRKHVMDGYRLLRGKFDFTAEVIAQHHRFQNKGYPAGKPKGLHKYSEGTRAMISMYARMLALADCYDALHRVNDKSGQTPLTGGQMEEKMYELNPDQRQLIREFYDAGIFTTYTLPIE